MSRRSRVDVSEFLGPSSAESEKSEDLVCRKKREETKHKERKNIDQELLLIQYIECALRLGGKKKRTNQRTKTSKTIEGGTGSACPSFRKVFSAEIWIFVKNTKIINKKEAEHNLKSLSPTYCIHLISLLWKHQTHLKIQKKQKSNQNFKFYNYTDLLHSNRQLCVFLEGSDFRSSTQTLQSCWFHSNSCVFLVNRGFIIQKLCTYSSAWPVFLGVSWATVGIVFRRSCSRQRATRVQSRLGADHSNFK